MKKSYYDYKNPSEATLRMIELLESNKSCFEHVHKTVSSFYASSASRYVKIQWLPEFHFELATRSKTSTYQWKSQTSKSEYDATQILKSLLGLPHSA